VNARQPDCEKSRVRRRVLIVQLDGQRRGTGVVALIVAGIALVGTVVTVVVSARSNKRLQREAQQFQRELENARVRREAGASSDQAEMKTRVAARLVQADLAWNRSRINQALATGNRKYWSSRYSLQQVAWDHQREILAADDSLTFEEWDKVRRAFRWTAALELLAAQRRESTGEKRPRLKDHGVDQLEKASRAVTKAIETLESYAQGVVIEEPSDEDPD
jgi:hypothetical protein